jgi:hypothetical protein
MLVRICDDHTATSRSGMGVTLLVVLSIVAGIAAVGLAYQGVMAVGEYLIRHAEDGDADLG